ncbi:MAG TPA: hypothetical protein VMW08_09305 [Acidimicrobiales bacterium]|nr:hypothetical protein [Acidimicrobiales bacterium]
MILAAVRDDAYNIVLLLHILAVIVGFAPAAVHPFIDAQLQETPDARMAFLRRAAANGHRIYLPAITIAGLLGIVLIIMSDDVIEFSDTWVSGSFVVWIAIMGIVAGMIIPGEKAAGQGDFSKERTVQIGGQISTLLLIVMLYLMIFKPGA